MPKQTRRDGHVLTFALSAQQRHSRLALTFVLQVHSNVRHPLTL